MTTEKKSGKQVKRKLILIGALAVLLLAAVLSVTFYVRYLNAGHQKELDTLSQEHQRELTELLEQYEGWEPVSTEVDFTALAGELRSIGELASMEYIYTDASKFADPKEIFGYEIPFGFTTKTFIVKWDGVIKAGIEVDQIQVDGSDSTITVTLPKAKILSHEIDNDSFETLDEKSGLFNPIKVGDVNTAIRDSKAAMEKRAVENGLLETAQENARALVQQLLLANPVIRDNYTIKFA